MHGLATALSKLELQDEFSILFNRCLVGREKVPRPDHPYTILTWEMRAAHLGPLEIRTII
jgi:hypothetical protein